MTADHSGSARGRHRLLVVIATVLVVGGWASPAWANGTEPPSTSYRSSVTASPTGLDARVLGGDAYLAVRVEPGVEALVPGYDGEPYLRVDADGTVWRNARSPATYLNRDRYGEAGGVRPPPEADPDAEPAWEEIAQGGRYAWHDHRIHWMSPDVPREAQGATAPVEVFDWTVPVEVDGAAGELRGELSWLPNRNPVGWLVAAGVLVAGGVWLARRSRPRLVTVGGAAAAAGLAVAVVAVELGAHVPGRGLPSAWYGGLIAAVGLLALAVAVWRGKSLDGPVLVAAFGAVGTVLVRVPALWQPVVPGPLPGWAARALVAITVAAAAVALAGLTAHAPAQPAAPATGSQPDDDDRARES